MYPLASLAQIEATPSREDGIPGDLEEDLRAYGCKLIHQAGILLKQYVYILFNCLNYDSSVRIGSRWPLQLPKFCFTDSGSLHP